MFKMYMEDIKWNGNSCVLIFSNSKDGGQMSIPVSESIGSDLRVLWNQKTEGIEPYFGICEFVKQFDGKFEKLLIRSSHVFGSAAAIVEISGKITEIELFFADVVSIAIVLNLPIYFDDAVCSKREATLADRLLWTRTESMTNYSFDTNS